MLLTVAGAFITYGVLSGRLALPLGDMGDYLVAATRLRHGDPLYLPADAGGVYRYSPWLAIVFVPLTYLPLPLVAAAWATLLIACSLYVLRPFASRWGWPALLILGPSLLYATWAGNVHPVVLAMLAFGLPRRSGPVWVGLAASLKITPILFAVWYAGRGERRRAALSVAIAAVLWAPALAFDLSSYASEPAQTLSLLGLSAPLWAAVALAAAAWAFLQARRPTGWLWTVVAVLAAQPRLLWYDLSYLTLASPHPGATPGSDHLNRVSEGAGS